MRKLVSYAFCAFLLAGSTAAAQEFKDGVYTNPKLKIKFTVDPKWTVRSSNFTFQWGKGTLAEAVSDDGQIGLILFEEQIGMKAVDYANAVERNIKALDNVEKYEKTGEGNPGRQGQDWVIRHYLMKMKKYKAFHRISAFFHSGKMNLHLAIWCYQSLYDSDEKYRKILKGVIESFQQTGGDAPKDPSKDTPNDTPKDPPDTEGGETITIPNPWKGCNPGSWVKYNMNSAGNKMVMIYVLVEQTADYYVQRTDMEMGGNKIKGRNTKVMLKMKKPKSTGGGGPKPTTEKGTETIKVPKGEFKCAWTKTTMKQGWSKSWTNDGVVLKVVRTESEYGGRKSVMELVDFGKK